MYLKMNQGGLKRLALNQTLVSKPQFLKMKINILYTMTDTDMVGCHYQEINAVLQCSFHIQSVSEIAYKNKCGKTTRNWNCS